MNFYGGIKGGTMKTWLNFGGNTSLLRWVNEQNMLNKKRGNTTKPDFHATPFLFLVGCIFERTQLYLTM